MTMLKEKGSIKALRLVLNTHNKISKNSITDMSEKTRKRVDKKHKYYYDSNTLNSEYLFL